MVRVSKIRNKPCVSRATLKSLRMIMADDYPEVLQTFLDVSLGQHTEMHTACEMEDYESLEVVSHEFKDSCENIGAESLSELADQIERLCGSGHYKSIDELIDKIDELYGICRLEIQTEQKRYYKIAI